MAKGMSTRKLVGPKEWLREHKKTLEGVQAMQMDLQREGRDVSPYSEEAMKERMGRAFEPIARYLGELAQGGVRMESGQWPATYEKAQARLEAPKTGATGHRVKFSQPMKTMSGEIEMVEWGFGVRVLERRLLRLRFQVYDFGVSGQAGMGGPRSQVFEGATEALKAYLEKIEDHMEGLEMQ
jgi:hypothetical protein